MPEGNDRSPESQQVQSLDKVFFVVVGFFFFFVCFFFFVFFFVLFFFFVVFFFENLIKIEDAGVATTLKIDFSNIQGQLTPQSTVESGSNSNLSKMLWLSWFLPRLKKIRSKLKALEWSQYKIMIFQTLKGSLLRSQRSDLAEIGTHARYCSYPCYLQE